MKRAEKIKRELKAIFKDKISDDDLMNFAWGLESIKQIIQDSPHLRTSVSYEKIKANIIFTFKAELRGEMKVLFKNRIIKASRILGSSTIDRLIPQIMDELTKGTVRPEFKKEKINLNGRYTKKEAADILNLSPGRIDQLHDEGKLEFLPEKFNRKNKRVISGAAIREYQKTEG